MGAGDACQLSMRSLACKKLWGVEGDKIGNKRHGKSESDDVFSVG